MRRKYPPKLASLHYWVGLATLAIGLLVTGGNFWIFATPLFLYTVAWLVLPTPEETLTHTLRAYAQKMMLSATTDEEIARAERLRQFIEG
jgi:hypothetical protein